MEKWQFLIQKEGERTWHPVQKPRVEIMEGRYRVVARSHRVNTDVEVRITHSSSSEVPPIRRIQKRRRRTSAEGLTAVIPFTYLKSGIWELQCSGDLMSDLLGASWQHTVSLVVVPNRIERKTVSPKNPSQSTHKQIQTQAKSKVNNVQSNSAAAAVNNLKTNDAGLMSSISIEPVKNASRNPLNPQLISTPKTVNTHRNKVASDKPTEKLRESLKAAPGKSKTSKTATQKLRDSIKVTPRKTAVASSVSQVVQDQVVRKLTPKSSEKSSTKQNKHISDESTLNLPVTKHQAENANSAQTENLAIIEQITPARVKGDTAEQILQNLIELALPSAETLLIDQTVEDTPVVPLPLQLNLDKTHYVAAWGESIKIEGLVQAKQIANELKHIAQAEVRIELISPQNSQLLQSSRQANPNQSLPFAIASSINIPSECVSKLILGEVKVYGVLSGHGAVELLASQSFTITADITELLAITLANPPGELARFDYSLGEFELSEIENLPQTLEPRMSLDLELFNLAKTAKQRQSLPGVPSSKRSLPLRVEPRYRGIARHPLKLPNVPGYQEKINEYINKGYIGNVSGAAITGTSFPFLRKLKALPSSHVEVETDISVEDSIHSRDTASQNIAETSAESEENNLVEVAIDQQPQDDNSVEFAEPVTPRNSEFIVPESNTSPLIRQWMLSQGYSLPEPIDVEYEDYDIAVSHSEIAPEQTTTKVDRNLPEIASNNSSVNIRPTSSPYFSISKASEWQVSQIATTSTQIEQEFVVDDVDIFADNIKEAASPQPDQLIDEPIKQLSAAVTISPQKIEQLPTPQLYVPVGELIAGKTLNVRVRLPSGNSDLAVKLWLEDCQTRHLLDTPQVLTNLTPNKNGELEVITKLNIPFGCIEIRLEAIAINTATQQESHKLTIQRTVIPPDLPNIQFDATLGM